MSDTFWQEDQDVTTSLYSWSLDQVIWLELSCCKITFDVLVSGNLSSLITKNVTKDYKAKTTMKAIIYTNSKMQALGLITNAMEKVLQTSKEKWRSEGLSDTFQSGKVIPMTGDDRLQFKVFTMHAFAKECNGLDKRDPILQNLVIMPATNKLCIANDSKQLIGKTDLGMHSIVLKLGNEKGEPTVLLDSHWGGIYVATNKIQ